MREIRNVEYDFESTTVLQRKKARNIRQTKPGKRAQSKIRPLANSMRKGRGSYVTCARSKELLDRRMNGDGFYASFLFDDCFSVLHQQNKHQSLSGARD